MAVRLTEIGLGNFEVYYIRDKEKREVDFVLVKDNEPVALFETKESDSSITLRRLPLRHSGMTESRIWFQR
jgi:predicted AAA+ superfamily ATPase